MLLESFSSRAAAGAPSSTESAGPGRTGCGAKPEKSRGHGVRGFTDRPNGSAGLADAGGDYGEQRQNAFGRVDVQRGSHAGSVEG